MSHQDYQAQADESKIGVVNGNLLLGNEHFLRYIDISTYLRDGKSFKAVKNYAGFSKTQDIDKITTIKISRSELKSVAMATNWVLKDIFQTVNGQAGVRKSETCLICENITTNVLQFFKVGDLL